MIPVALIEGLIWSVLWMIYVYILVSRFPWEMLHDYPEDIQKASTLPAPSDEQKKKAKIFSVLFSLVIFGALIVFGVLQYVGEKVSFQENKQPMCHDWALCSFLREGCDAIRMMCRLIIE